MTRRAPRDTQLTHRCGYRTPLTTAGLARKGLAGHDCARYERLAASAARGRARAAAVDRTPQPCLHKVARHQHGTRACYTLDRCRCAPCAAARRLTDRTRERQTAYGRWQPYVDAAPVREHVTQLTTAGLGLKRIALLSGVAHGCLWKLMYGKTQPDGTRRQTLRVRPATADALLAVTADLANLGQTVGVDSTGTRRRLQALVALGWSQSALARRLGMEPSNFGGVMHRDRCQAATARRVQDLYDELRTHRPPETTHRERQSASRARNHAARNGWPVPMFWDDDLIDDPTTTGDVDLPVDGPDVDDIAVERFLAGERLDLTRDERHEAARRLHTTGLSVSQISMRLGMNRSVVLKAVASQQDQAVGL